MNVTGTCVTILGGTVLWLIGLAVAGGGVCESIDASSMSGLVKGLTQLAFFCFV